MGGASPGLATPRPPAAPHPDSPPLATRSPRSDLPHAGSGSGGVRQILMAKKGKGKMAKKLAALPRCNRCFITQCFRSKKARQRSRCVGKCKKKGRMFTCSTTKGDFKTCTRQGQCWDASCDDDEFNVPVEPLIPLAGVVVSAPVPYIPCVVTTNHPTGCPAPGAPIARGGGTVELVSSTCVTYKHRLSDCESPYLPFGYCTCQFDIRGPTPAGPIGVIRTEFRACRYGEFDAADLPFTAPGFEPTPESDRTDYSPDNVLRIRTSLPEQSVEGERPSYAYNATLQFGDDDVDVKMTYFRRISVLADRFTYTGAYADGYSGADYERTKSTTKEEYIFAFAGDGDYDLGYRNSGHPNFTPDDRGGLDYMYVYPDDDAQEGVGIALYISYADGGSSGDSEYDAIVGVDGSDADIEAAAYDYTVDEEATEYYFQYNKYTLEPERQDCDLKCSFEGGGVLGNVRESYGVEGPYSVYYLNPVPEPTAQQLRFNPNGYNFDSNFADAVPTENCPACPVEYGGPPDGAAIDIARGTPLEPGPFEVFLGDVPEEERFDAGEVRETAYT